jgi:hypothetical protein
MNPNWALTAFMVMKTARQCPHCAKRVAYPRERHGQFHTCKFRKRKLKEKGE